MSLAAFCILPTHLEIHSWPTGHLYSHIASQSPNVCSGQHTTDRSHYWGQLLYNWLQACILCSIKIHASIGSPSTTIPGTSIVERKTNNTAKSIS
jgi:hypothetical protein